MCTKFEHIRRCDGIGRRDGLKIRWGDPCRFKSGHRYHYRKKSIVVKQSASFVIVHK